MLEWKRADQKWVLGKSMGQSKLVKELRIHAKDPNSITKDNFVQTCEMLSGTKKLAAHIDTLVNAKTVFAGIYNGEASDTARMKTMLDNSVKLRELFAVTTLRQRRLCLAMHVRSPQTAAHSSSFRKMPMQ